MTNSSLNKLVREENEKLTNTPTAQERSSSGIVIFLFHKNK